MGDDWGDPYWSGGSGGVDYDFPQEQPIIQVPAPTPSSSGGYGISSEDNPDYTAGSTRPGSSGGVEIQDQISRTTGGTWFDKLLGSLNNSGKIGGALASGLGALNSKGGIAALLALLSAMDRKKPSGGGTTQAYAGPAPLTRTIAQGKYGPIARYAADGGIMHAYAQGGPVAMEDGGFVMTKRAVDGAGGPQGIQQLVPGARMIRGPGTGTSDSIPAYIQGRDGRTPAALSNGEAYVPKRHVEDAGGARKLYALMNQLQRRA